ncbi:hypothetical protein BGLA2_500003 [Burkholderia gladioli]|nr:hypothetical protein BGLA2_500003 [Burkholderia gladioli]
MVARWHRLVDARRRSTGAQRRRRAAFDARRRRALAGRVVPERRDRRRRAGPARRGLSPALPPQAADSARMKSMKARSGAGTSRRPG